MKKLLVFMLVGFGAAMLVKHGQVTVSPDNQLRVVGFAVPLPDAIQRSPIMGMIAGMLPNSAVAAAAPGAQRPMMPTVNSAYDTFDANSSGRTNASAGNLPTGADGFSAAAKAIRGSQ